MSAVLKHEQPEPSYLTATKGIRSWLFTVDHKRIGVMYLVATTLFMMTGGILAGLLRIELFTPQGDLVDADTYNHTTTRAKPSGHAVSSYS